MYSVVELSQFLPVCVNLFLKFHNLPVPAKNEVMQGFNKLQFDICMLPVYCYFSHRISVRNFKPHHWRYPDKCFTQGCKN